MFLDRYSVQFIDESDVEAVLHALKSGVLTGGAAIEEFERAICDYTGAKHAIAVANATAGLHIACLAAGLSGGLEGGLGGGLHDGCEAITSPITFAATANAVLYCGATPVFADIDAKSGLIDPAAIEAQITSKTKAILPVHYAGSLCDMEAIGEIARRHGLVVIEDAAHALGSFDAAGRSAGTFGDMGVFSFHPVKPITTGEGGAIVTNSDALAGKLRLLRSHGIERGELWRQDMKVLGFNYRLSDLAAALGVSQMAKIDRTIALRAEIAGQYDRAFGSMSLCVPPQKQHSRHLYPILLKDGAAKTELFLRLKSRGIGVQSHYAPVYSHSFYRRFLPDFSLPNAEKFYETELSIACHSLLDEGEIQAVIDAVLAK